MLSLKITYIVATRVKGSICLKMTESVVAPKVWRKLKEQRQKKLKKQSFQHPMGISVT